MSKNKKLKNEVPKYTLGEELINSISHGIGAGLSIAGLVLIIIRAHSAIGIVSSVIYATCRQHTPELSRPRCLPFCQIFGP